MASRTSASGADWYQFAVRDGDTAEKWEIIGMQESPQQVDPNGVLRDPRVLRCPVAERCEAQIKVRFADVRGVPSDHVEVLRLDKLPITRFFQDGNGALVVQSAPRWFPAPEGAMTVRWTSDRGHSVIVLLGMEQEINVWPWERRFPTIYIDTSTGNVDDPAP